MRYAIVFCSVSALVLFAVAVVNASSPTRGADIPVCRSAQPKINTDKQPDPRDNAAPAAPTTRFATITVSIDPKGTPLAAYQFELTAGHAFTVVGLDNGGNAAFPGPPRYDRSADADATDRLIVADYSTAGPGQLIAKPYPVATIHAAFTPPEDGGAGLDLDPLRDSIELTLTAAADAGGNRIDADITYDLHFAERPGTE